MPPEGLKDVESHFAFGRNWASYAKLIDQGLIEEAKRGLLKLVRAELFRDCSFLDIGCGSGLHALAAAELGAGRIMAVDIDADSVATTRNVLSRQNVSIPWSAERHSVFELDPERLGRFDIVYSWGVLHHTGDMWEALGKAAAMVAPKGRLVVALYRKTRMDPFWKLEKRIYAHAPSTIQGLLRAGYVTAFRLAKRAAGKDTFKDYVANYKSSRGMDFYHDVHDWLGGYPYETALAFEVDSKLKVLGFEAEQVYARPMQLGVFGSGCDEYVYRLAQ